jgi:AcrR family transcriptional regulator
MTSAATPHASGSWSEAAPGQASKLTPLSIAEKQRLQTLRAMAELLAERGMAGASITTVTRRALISRATFARLFGDVEGCLVALLGHLAAQAVDVFEVAFQSQPSWIEGVIEGLESLLQLLDAEPALTRACLLHASATPAAALAHRPSLIERTRSLVVPALPVEARPGSAVIAEAILDAVTGILRMRLITDQAPPFVDLLADLVAVLVLSCLGPEQALQARELARRRTGPLREKTPLPLAATPERLPIELRRANAHKAREALRYIAAHPGASNNQVAAGADVPHLGQVSRLLSRLEAAGLLIKRPGGAGRPNAWALSSRGEEAVRVLGALSI